MAQTKQEKIKERDALIVRLLECLEPDMYTDHQDLVVECLRVMGYEERTIRLYLAGEVILTEGN